MTEVTERKAIITESAGPSSYTSGGFDVEVSELAKVSKSAVLQITGGYIAEVTSISGNKPKVKVYYFDYDAAADGAAIEVAAGTDLSGVTVTLLSYGL